MSAPVSARNEHSCLQTVALTKTNPCCAVGKFEMCPSKSHLVSTTTFRTGSDAVQSLATCPGFRHL